MGWACCAYRDCKVRSKDPVHLFHFPVFDKVRCYKWLQNAQRMDFLSLTVSQLKNRMICEHHFEEDQFMNHTKQKIKSSAIPTLDGPYCSHDSSVKIENNVPFIEEQIDTESVSAMDKKAQMSMKYGNFLTNCEIMDLDGNTNKTSVKEIQIGEKVPFSIFKKQKRKLLKDLRDGKYEYKNLNTKIVTNIPQVEIETPNDKQQSKEYIETNENITIINNPVKSQIDGNSTPVPKKKNKINIISHTKIIPSSTSNNNKTLVVVSDMNTTNTKEDLSLFASFSNKENSTQKGHTAVVANTKLVPSGKQSLLKSPKVRKTVDEVAAISEKREFNKKLSDVLSKNLVSLNDAVHEPVKQPEIDTQTAMAHLSSEPTLPTSQESLLSYMENRIKRMEALLLNRIDANTQIIHTLKNSIDPNSTQKPKHWNISTQTHSNEEGYKKALFNEISQFLNSDVKSAVYEELFINKKLANTKSKTKRT